MAKEVSDTTAAPEAKPRKLQPARPADTKLNESANNVWRHVAPRGVTREELRISDYWSIVSSNFLPFDLVRVIAEDRSYYAELLVLESGRGYASIVELSFHPLPAIILSRDGVPPNFDVFHAGPEKLYCVKRLSDGVLIGEGFSSRDAALQHLLSHASLR